MNNIDRITKSPAFYSLHELQKIIDDHIEKAKENDQFIASYPPENDNKDIYKVDS